MGGAEDGVDGVAVGPRTEVQQPGFHRLQALGTFLQEDFEDFLHFEVG